MNATEPHLALYRFGLGPRGDEQAPADPRGWALAQLQTWSIPEPLSQLAAAPDDGLLPLRGDPVQRQESQRLLRQRFIAETAQRFVVQLASDQPLQERLLLFFSNHFCVSLQKPIIAGLVNRYEIQAIRPHLGGHFADMLLAVARHPAMTLYLDNARSIGPDSRAGQRRGKDINENFAREVMELHTLGVDGGYTQDDVIALARILSGWSLERGPDGPLPRYAFRPEIHEPGAKRLLGRTFADGGEDEGKQALRFLARQPATARHLSYKLARHFVADQPPADLVQRLQRTWQDSDGHLPSVMAELIRADQAWTPGPGKLRSPYEFAVASLRLCQLTPQPQQILQGLQALDARPFGATSPAGDGDTAQACNGASSLLKRITWSYRLAQRVPPPAQPLQLADSALGPLLSATSRTAISRAPSASDAFALLLASPEFQRR